MVTASSPAWKIETRRRMMSRSSSVAFFQSSLSWVKSMSAGSQIPSFLAFWKSLIGTESVRSPPADVVR
jgi:hypothetical protein